MSKQTQKIAPALNDHMTRSERLVFRFSITANATPASKVHVTDVPRVILRTQGLTAKADAVEALTWTSAVDATNAVFGVLVQLAPNKAFKVQKATVTEITSLATSTAVRGANNVADAYVTPAGNLALEIVGTGLDLVTESPTYVVEVEYLEAR